MKAWLSAFVSSLLYSVSKQFETARCFSSTEIDGYEDLVKGAVERARMQMRASPSVRLRSNVIFVPKNKALYDLNGDLVPESALVRWRDGNYVSASNKIDIKSLGRLDEIDSAIYGGVIFDSHFGHFVCETLPRFWPLLPGEGCSSRPNKKWICSLSSGRATLNRDISFIEQSVGCLESIAFDPVFVDTPTLIKTISIPESSHAIGLGGSELFRDLCKELGQCILKGSRDFLSQRYAGGKYYLSRASLKGNRRRIVGEDVLQRELKKRGYEIVFPELLPFSEQIALFLFSSSIVACIGSSLHAQIFAEVVRAKVVYITDEKPSQTFFNFDYMCGTNSKYILALSRSRFESKFIKQQVLNVDAVLREI